MARTKTTRRSGFGRTAAIRANDTGAVFQSRIARTAGLAAAALSITLVAGCNSEGQFPQLSEHARNALQNATSVQDVMDAETAPQVAAASCKMYTGWLQLDADVRVAVAGPLTEHINHFTSDSDTRAVQVIRLTSELINTGTERHRDLTDKLASACRYLR